VPIDPTGDVNGAARHHRTDVVAFAAAAATIDPTPVRVGQFLSWLWWPQRPTHTDGRRLVVECLAPSVPGEAIAALLNHGALSRRGPWPDRTAISSTQRASSEPGTGDGVK
jgi:hypothetical protein